MNANLIFKWLKDPRFAPAEGGPSPEESITLEGVFLPVEIETPALESPTALAHDLCGHCVSVNKQPISLVDRKRRLTVHYAILETVPA